MGIGGDVPVCNMSRFNVFSLWRNEITIRPFPRIAAFEEIGQPKQNQTDVRLFINLTAFSLLFSLNFFLSPAKPNRPTIQEQKKKID